MWYGNKTMVSRERFSSNGMDDSSVGEGLLVTRETLDSLTEAFDSPDKLSFRRILSQVRVARGVDSSQTFSADYWSFCIIKPDAKEMEIEEEICRKIGERKLGIKAVRYGLELDEPMLDQIWPAPVGGDGQPLPVSPWWSATINYMTSRPVDLMLVRGDDASRKMKDVKAELRDKYYTPGYQKDTSLSYDERVRSIIHTSDSDPELFINTFGFWSRDELREITQAADTSESPSAR